MPIVRCAQIKDAKAAYRVKKQSIKHLCKKSYTKRQLEALLSERYDENKWYRYIKNDLVWIIEHDGVVEGYGRLQLVAGGIGHIADLYLTSVISGKGLAQELLLRLEQSARKNKVSKIELKSTVNAKTFYEKMGYIQEDEAENFSIRDELILHYPMFKMFEEN